MLNSFNFSYVLIGIIFGLIIYLHPLFLQCYQGSHSNPKLITAMVILSAGLFVLIFHKHTMETYNDDKRDPITQANDIAHGSSLDNSALRLLHDIVCYHPIAYM